MCWKPEKIVQRVRSCGLVDLYLDLGSPNPEALEGRVDIGSPFMSARFLHEHYYRGIRSPLKERLFHFRESHCAVQVDSNGDTWSYFVGGASETTLVLLPGGLGVAEPWFDCMLDWERHFRVVAISYPRIRDVSSAVRAISSILEREGGSRRCLLGTSLGGEIAQAFLRDRPLELTKIILGNTGEANADYGEKLRRKMPIIKLFDNRIAFSLIKLVAKRRVLGLVSPYVSGDELAFWKAYMNDIIDNQYSSDLMQSQFDVLRDFATNYSGPLELSPRTGMLIIEAEDDKMFSPVRRQSLKRFFPAARVKTFDRGGHLLPLTKRNEYVAEVSSFISSG